MPPFTVDAILMASGFSRRFGEQNKLLVPVEGVPLARRTLELVAGMDCFAQRLFVYAQREVGALAQGLPGVTAVLNPHPQQGQRESVRLGVAASSADFYLFFPCDQPFLDEATITAIVVAAQPGGMVVPCHQGTPGNPALFSCAFRQELLGLAEGQHPRNIKQRHPDKVRCVELSSPRPLLDIDRLQDWRRLNNMN